MKKDLINTGIIRLYFKISYLFYYNNLRVVLNVLWNYQSTCMVILEF